MIKFNMYNIADTETGLKIKVSYYHWDDVDGKTVIRIYEDGYSRKLFKLFPNAKNDSDSMTDYFENTTVKLSEGDKYYSDALTVIKKLEIKTAQRRQKQLDKHCAYLATKASA